MCLAYGVAMETMLYAAVNSDSASTISVPETKPPGYTNENRAARSFRDELHAQEHRSHSPKHPDSSPSSDGSVSGLSETTGRKEVTETDTSPRANSREEAPKKPVDTDDTEYGVPPAGSLMGQPAIVHLVKILQLQMAERNTWNGTDQEMAAQGAGLMARMLTATSNQSGDLSLGEGTTEWRMSFSQLLQGQGRIEANVIGRQLSGENSPIHSNDLFLTGDDVDSLLGELRALWSRAMAESSEGRPAITPKVPHPVEKHALFTPPPAEAITDMKAVNDPAETSPGAIPGALEIEVDLGGNVHQETSTGKRNGGSGGDFVSGERTVNQTTALGNYQNVSELGRQDVSNDIRETAARLVEQVREPVVHAIRKGVDTIHIRLKPEGLGEIHIDVVSRDRQEVVLRVMTSSQGARQVIEAGLPELRHHLQASGLTLNEARVTERNPQGDGQHQQNQHHQHHHEEPRRQNREEFKEYMS